MDIDLMDLLSLTYRDYLRFRDVQHTVLLYMNTLALSTVADRELVYVRNVTPSSDYLSIPSNPLAERPKGNQYLPTNMNIKPEEHEDLRSLPFEESSGRVCKPSSLETNYHQTPFDEYKHAAEIIENQQLADFLMLKLLLTCPEFNIRTVAKLLDKTAAVIQDLKSDVKLHYLSPIAFVGTDVKGLENKFCRICKTISCFLHFPSTTKSVLVDTFYGHQDQRNEHAGVVMQHVDNEGWKNNWYKRSLSTAEHGGWMLAHRCLDLKTCSRTQRVPEIYIPSAAEKWIAKVLLRKGIINPCIISEFADMTCIQAASVLQSLNESGPDLSVRDTEERTFPAGDAGQYQFEAHHISEPSNCSCTECTPESCLCFERKGSDEPRNCCEKFCECPLKCSRRFLGCNCKYGGCTSNTCVCFANNRECDPDVCVACSASVNLKHPRSLDLCDRSKKSCWVLCRNTVIQNFKRKRTAIARSTIPGAGYGLFALESIRANEYITEYTGELISDSEAERRGTLYDSKEHSYIFSLTSEQSLDATLMGNKMRYANHRAGGEENCFARNMRVMGNTKVILLAKRDIQYGEELFFDYGYKKDQVKYTWFLKYSQEMEDRKKKPKRKTQDSGK